jgi:hypothetical protein
METLAVILISIVSRNQEKASTNSCVAPEKQGTF